MLVILLWGLLGTKKKCPLHDGLLETSSDSEKFRMYFKAPALISSRLKDVDQETCQVDIYKSTLVLGDI